MNMPSQFIPNTAREDFDESEYRLPAPEADIPAQTMGSAPAVALHKRDIPLPVPETLVNPLYIPGFLATQIGRLMQVEFLVGSALDDRVGRLVKVGAGYIVLEPLETGSYIMCDINAIKFVTIITGTDMVYALG